MLCVFAPAKLEYLRIISPVKERKSLCFSELIMSEHIFFKVWHPVAPASQPSNIVPKSFHSISSLQDGDSTSVSPDGYPVSKILKLRGNSQLEGFFFFLFSAYVCFYFFVKQKMSYFGSYIG